MRNWISNIVMACLMVTGAVVAQETEQAESPETIAKSRLETMLQLSVSSVADAPVEGLLQVMTNRGLFYVTKDGQFLVHGRIYNMEEQMRNETEEALGVVRLEGVKKFDGAMIEFKAENERYAISVFTDITCGYCRKLHNEIEQYNKRGITVRYLAFPRGGVSSRAYDDMVSVWCADDQQSAMTAAKAGDSIPPQNCKTNVAEQYEFGQQVGVTGTPAIILEDGSMIPGYQPASELEKVLAMR
ncbi:MAG: bifunctional protein-disulfide isomerase/oxidoreductase DsbC [Aestuariibacter sp.]